LRKYYSIEDALLEKRLLYNASRITKEISSHVITNLSTYYDRQLANIESLVLESVEVNRQIAALIVKVLPSFKYYIYTSYGICKSNYGSETDSYGGTG